jgi:hypothetical protein
MLVKLAKRESCSCGRDMKISNAPACHVSLLRSSCDPRQRSGSIVLPTRFPLIPHISIAMR